MNQTPNYSLSQWELTDQVKMEDFNADNAKLDAALAGHDARLARLGNCRIETFAYVGDGRVGSENPTRVHFSARPVVVLIASPQSLAVAAGAGDVLSTACHYVDGAAFCGSTMSWEGNDLLIRSSVVAAQANAKGVTYRVFAFYAEDGK